jgi:hypothetical protein
MTETVTKLIGYSFQGADSDVERVSKANGYALEGTIGGGPKVSKLLAYALVTSVAQTRPVVSNSIRIGPVQGRAL